MGMPAYTSYRVARRYVGSSLIKAAVLAHVDRDGVRWGWFSGEIARLHVVPFDLEHRGAARVWLEDGHGNRSFQVDREPLDLDLDALWASVSRTRDTIEAAWLRSCSRRGWLDYSPRKATISLYPGTPHEVRRSLKERAFTPEFLQVDASTNAACLEVRLNRLIWQGADDGSEAESA